jgi:hypothetical protein
MKYIIVPFILIFFIIFYLLLIIVGLLEFIWSFNYEKSFYDIRKINEEIRIRYLSVKHRIIKYIK